jgi:diguanylate cyclase (GGDEF)-like protein
MDKKWGYIAGGAAIVASIATLTTLLIDSDLLSDVLALITIITCGAALTSFHFIHKAQEKKPVKSRGSSEPKPMRRHTESIAHAVDHPHAASEVAQVNSESAESATADKLADAHRDDESGLLSGSFFPVYLEQRITAARRTLRPVSLVIFELDGLDKNDSHSPSDRNFFVSAVGDVVKRTLRESDCAFRIDENTFAAVMDDTTESGAVWAAERVRGVLHTGALAGRVTVSAGVACYPSHALETDDLIACANKALDAARSRGVDQVEIAAEQR